MSRRILTRSSLWFMHAKQQEGGHGARRNTDTRLDRATVNRRPELAGFSTLSASGSSAQGRTEQSTGTHGRSQGMCTSGSGRWPYSPCQTGESIPSSLGRRNRRGFQNLPHERVQVQLRARVRELIAAGELPNEPPMIQSSGKNGWRPELGRRTSRIETCAICGEPGPTVAYFWRGGRCVSLHAACDALWKLERD